MRTRSIPTAARLALLLLAMSAGAAAHAHDYRTGDIAIAHPWAPPPPPGAASVAGYLAISNEGDTEDRLLGATATFAERVEIHETRIEDDVARMRELTDGVVLPGGEAVDFEPNGRHLMFVGHEPLREGDRVTATLIFERSGEVEVEFAVEFPDADGGTDAAAPAMDHGEMDHEAMDHGAMDHGSDHDVK